MTLELDREATLAHYRNLLAHRSQGDGQAKPGYKANVAILRREIAKLESEAAQARGGADGAG